ncbi:hypothetical protein HGRIS_013531 [Hohenbuehelia grisea]|uniref:Chord-domain-containing protein n=1 Tax=Hohenbuehelia grisea TaxID=104357 RepID=A0ABR3IVN2_9AGAR
MPQCTRKGCNKQFSADISEACVHHPGGPVFHEGLKSWSCCQDYNKPVLSFDDFMQISGCATAESHTTESAPAEAPKSGPSIPVSVTTSPEGQETFSSGKPPAVAAALSAPTSTTQAAPVPEEEDNLDAAVTPGTICKRKGCGVVFESDVLNRKGDDPKSVCMYHPSPPYFREGSKGYLCCKRRVLEFDEFLKIEGCKKGRHVFVPKVTKPVTEEMTDCRVDHYQTVDQVHVSVFAKKVDKERSTVQFKEEQVDVDLYLPDCKRFKRTLDLFGPIDPAASSFSVLGTKVELHLRKQDSRSWTILEKTTQDLGNISLTFGVGGRTGTIGAKNLALDESNKARRA